MRTTSLDGKDGSSWARQAKRGLLRPYWEVRLIDFQGNRLDDTVWKVDTIPRGAMLHRVRTRDLEAGTTELDLEIAVDALPLGVTIEQYDGIEIDLVFARAGRWGYFYGEIDHAPTSWQDRDGVPVLGQMVKAWGILQRCKGPRVNVFVSRPEVGNGAGNITNEKLMGVCSTVKAQATTSIGQNTTTTGDVAPLAIEILVTAGEAERFKAGQPVQIKGAYSGNTAVVRLTGVDTSANKLFCTPVPGPVTFSPGATIRQAEYLPVAAVTYFLTETFGGDGIVISGNADYSSPKVLNTDYVVDTSIGMAVIAWINQPPSTRYFRYFKLERFVLPRVTLYIRVTAGGSGYTSAPTVTIGAPTQINGLTATATAIVSGGQVAGIVVTYQGAGYTGAPSVTLSGGGGSGASVVADIHPSWYVLETPGAFDPTLGPLNTGRHFTDLYHTTAESIAGNVITPRDKAPFTVSGLFRVYNQDEFLIIEPSGGAFAGQEVVRRISSVNASTGEITVDYLPDGFVAGDKMRVATTEHWPAWDDTQDLHFYDGPNMGTGSNEYPRRWFNPMPGVGAVLQTEARNWTSSKAVYAKSMAPIKDPTDDVDPYYGYNGNRVENRLHVVLTDASANGLGLFKAGTTPANGQFRVSRTGAIMRNYVFFGRQLPELIEDFMKMLPSHVKLLDHPGDASSDMGKHGYITLGPVAQKTTPDLALMDVRGPTVSPAPEPYTVTLAIAEGEPVNLAQGMVSVIENCRDPFALVDNTRDVDCHALDPAASMGIKVRVPRITPSYLFPFLDKLVITGRGLLTVFVAVDGKQRFIPPWTSKPFGKPGGVVGPIALAATASPTATQLTLADIKGITPGMVLTLIERSGGTIPGTRTTVMVREINPVSKVIYLRDAIGGSYTFSTNATAEGSSVTNESVELDQAALARGMGWNGSYSTQPTDIYIQVDQNKDITGPAVSEIEAYTSIHGAWAAKFTSLTTQSPANNGAAEYGTVWQQWDIRQRSSARYVPPEILRRIVPKWDTGASGSHRHRVQIRRAPGVSIQAARDIAERDQDETLRLGTEYSVTALLDPRAELGDTVFYTDPAGNEYAQLLTRTRDAGGPEDLDMDYTLRDYSLGA